MFGQDRNVPFEDQSRDFALMFRIADVQGVRVGPSQTGLRVRQFGQFASDDPFVVRRLLFREEPFPGLVLPRRQPTGPDAQADRMRPTQIGRAHV